MKNNKGFTVIELITSFVLISLIVALLFEVLFIVKNLFTDSGIKTELLVKQALISEKINDELNAKSIMIANTCGDNCVKFTFTDGTSSELSLNRKEKTFKYGDYKTSLIQGSEYGNIDISTETVLNVPTGLNDSIVKIEIPIYHKLIKQENFGINIVYQYDSRNTAISGIYISDVVDVEKKIHLIGTENDIAFTGIEYVDPGYYVSSDSGIVTNDPNVIVDGTVGNVVGETYTIKYTILDMNSNVMDTVTRNVTLIDSTTVFNYNGTSQGYVVPVDGLYKIEVWGAQGGTVGDNATGGKGGYTTGQISLSKGDTLDIYVGGQGSFSKNEIVNGGFNGGGASGYGSDTSGASGGGASDVRLGGSSLENRIIVAGGGGGAGSRNDASDPSNGGSGGGTTGLAGAYSTASYNGAPGTNSQGGLAATYTTNVTTLPTSGSLGQGGNGGSYSDTFGGGGGGAGYYGGGAGVRYGSGAGGSGYCGTMLSCTTYDGTQDFLSADGISSETGHSGNGTVKISLVSISTQTYRNDIMTSTSNCINTGSCPNGTLVNVQVNDNQSHNFYVIKDTGTELTLIMDRNLLSNIAWVNEEHYKAAGGTNWNAATYGNVEKGPLTALISLDEATDDEWSNIPKRDYKTQNDIDNLGGTYTYPAIIKNMRARMLSYAEAIGFGCLEGSANKNTCPDFLVNNIDIDGFYWLPAVYSLEPDIAYSIYVDRNISNGYITYNGGDRGIRPVITLTK